MSDKDRRGELLSVAVILAVVATAGCSTSNPPASPAPPPAEGTFTPYTVAPSILNAAEVAAAIRAEYPPELRSARIGGTVTLFVFVGTDGIPREVRLRESSGHRGLDDAAAMLSPALRFSPAIDNDGVIVPVWVSFPITFVVRRRG